LDFEIHNFYTKFSRFYLGTKSPILSTPKFVTLADEPTIQILAKYYELTYAISINSFQGPGRYGAIPFFPVII